MFSPVITYPCAGVLSHRHFLIRFRFSSARMILLSLGLYAFFLLLFFFFFSSRGENRIPFLLVLQLLLFQEARGLPNLEQIPRDRVVCSEVVAISGCDAAASFRPRCPVCQLCTWEAHDRRHEAGPRAAGWVWGLLFPPELGIASLPVATDGRSVPVGREGGRQRSA